MKKALSIMLALVLVFGLAGCSAPEETESDFIAESEIVDKDTGNFRYVKVQDGEKFLAQA